MNFKIAKANGEVVYETGDAAEVMMGGGLVIWPTAARTGDHKSFNPGDWQHVQECPSDEWPDTRVVEDENSPVMLVARFLQKEHNLGLAVAKEQASKLIELSKGI